MTSSIARQDPRATPYQLFMLALCLYAVIALAIQTVVPLAPSTHSILEYADNAVCLLFFLDFLITLALAPNKIQYLVRWGWIDLLSSIPAVDLLRFGRVARILRIFRVLRGVRATKLLSGFILDRRGEGSVLAATLISLLLVVFSSVAILQFENIDGSNIRTAEDAVWWSVVTITTVGYGDRFPVSPEGRVVAAILMTAGVGLFGTFSGFVASWFLAPAAKARTSELDEVRSELAALRRLLERPAMP